ncbi:START domain-containing protein [Neptunicella sp. SCSIO 80796]|uniref:START domain-containing protein n=1 Tax=Neptunicella plasticusilytica TaxID=3117012 RepID=UPI003A4DD3FF
MQSLICMLLFSMTLSCAAQEWQLENEKDQIKLFSQNTSSGIKKVKAITTIHSRLGALILLLDDTEKSSDWIDSIDKVELIERPQLNQAIVHSYFSAPWPIEDRDMITLSNTFQNKQNLQIRIDIQDYGEHYPKHKDYIRMHSVQGTWLVSPLPDGQIEIQYQGTADPAGHIPLWLVNKIMLSSTRNTFKQLRRIIVKPEYQTEPPSYIHEIASQIP